MKKIVKVILFITFLFILWKYVFSILWLPKNNISYFYEEPKNTLDIIYIGASNVDQYFNPLLAFDLYGFTTGFLSTSSQPFIATKLLIQESLKTQKPSLYIIDLIRSQDDFSFDYSEVRTREVIDSIPFSINKINTIDEILKYGKVSNDEYINYYFSFFKYHNIWRESYNSRLYKIKNKYKGYTFYADNLKQNPQKENIWKDEIIEMENDNKTVLLELLDYIKKKNLNVLFVVPKVCNNWTPNQERTNAAIRLIEQNGYNVINFNKRYDFIVDYETDFYNSSHLNIYGATKYTLYLSEYLKNNYKLPNHKGDINFETWQDGYYLFKDELYNSYGINFDSILLKYKQNY